MNHDRAPNRRRALLGLVLLPTVAGASAVLSGCRSPAGRTSTASASATVDASGPQLVTSRDDLLSPQPDQLDA